MAKVGALYPTGSIPMNKKWLLLLIHSQIHTCLIVEIDIVYRNLDIHTLFLSFYIFNTYSWDMDTPALDIAEQSLNSLLGHRRTFLSPWQKTGLCNQLVLEKIIIDGLNLIKSYWLQA